MPARKILFICIGNACRSQMAEAFARAYGGAGVEPHSAGLSPAMGIPPATRAVMREKNIDLGDQFPKPLQWMLRTGFDVVVNLSGCPLPGVPWPEVREWKVADPIGRKDHVYRQVRDEIEAKVNDLLTELHDLTPEP